KTLIALLVVATFPQEEAGRWVAISGGAFILPFIGFSTLAGDVADRWPKKKLVVWFKMAEVAIMALTWVALYTRSMPFLTVLLFLMGMHSAFFGPVKLAILP